MKLLAKAEQSFFFLNVVLLPTQLGKHYFENFSYIFSLPVDYLAPTVYIWDILVLLLLSVWVLQSQKLNRKPLALLMLFILTQSVSLFFGTNLGAGLYRLEQLIITGLFGVYIAAIGLTKIKLIYVGLVIAVLYESFISIGQFLFEKSLGFWILGERSFTISTPSIARFDFFSQVFLRAYGTFSHPNVLAAFMIIAATLITVFYKHYPTRAISKNVYYLTFIAAAVTTLLSFSRAGLIALATELFLILNKRLKLLLILGVILLPFLLVRYLSLINFDTLSLVRREQLTISALKFFSQSPLFGIGLNNFINYMATSELVAGPSRFLQPVHNIFLLVLAETGILGLVGYLSLIIAPFLGLWKKRAKPLSKALIGCWLVVFFLGSFDHYFFTLPQGQRLFFLIWGLSFFAIFETDNKKTKIA